MATTTGRSDAKARTAGRSAAKAEGARASKSLREYERKRNFGVTSEPSAAGKERGPRQARSSPAKALQFVVQMHDARRLHYDFRLELDGALKSWAVPKGPSLDPKVKRLAVHVEDHPLDYAGFEGHIPEGEYGGGDVIVWDRGVWEADDADAAAAYRAGKLKFHLLGEKLSGGWTLVRTRLRGSGDKEQWLLIKEADEDARQESDYDVITARPESVLTHAKLTLKRTRREAEISPDKAKPAPLPARLAPELATPVDQAPAGDWRYEIKFDGYRLLARVDSDAAPGQAFRLFTRTGLDWTDKLKPLADAVRTLGLKSAWLDGEIIVFDAEGMPDFQALQNAFEGGRTDDIVYYLFDIPYHAGLDLRASPLEQRRELLRKLLARGDAERRRERLRYSEDFPARQEDILRSACELKLEGVIGKRAGSPYVSRRSADWIKLKCKPRQEFVIVGHSAPQGSRSSFGALLLGVHDERGGLRYAGRVGTGFSETSLRALHAQMQPLARPSPPLADPPTGRDVAGVIWVEPRLLCEVEFAAWTREGVIRQAAFHGLRDDKPARAIVREQPKAAEEVSAAAGDKSGAKAKGQSRERTLPPLQGEGWGGDGVLGPTKKAEARRSQPHPPPVLPLEGGGTLSPAVRAISRTKNRRAEVAGIAISHPDRVIDVDSGTTKLALAEFYRDIAPHLLPHLVGRPLSILRAPTGVAGEQFFQRHPETLALPGIRLVDPGPGSDDDEPLMEVDTLKALIGVVQMGSIEFHTWNSGSKQIDRPDRLIFDLDPDPALPWPRMVEATRLVLTLLEELGLETFLKTSGGKGMHVVVPLARRHDWTQVKAFSKGVTEHLARILPRHFADRMGPKNRVGRIFVDYLRNQEGASTVAAYSVRARPGLPVSVPIAKDELERIGGAAEWTVRNLPERLERLDRDPWAGYANAQSITRAMRDRLGVE